MKSKEPTPPRWAEAILRSAVSLSDRESISGDLLEEYRDARRPALGALRANAWYIKQVLSVLLRLVWPCAFLIAGLTLVSLMLQGISVGYGSPLPAPGLSLIHALIYLWAGYHGSRRTRLIRAGILTAGITSVVGVTTFFAVAAATIPGLVIASLSMPFTFVILSIYHLLALSYGVLLGALGGTIGKWLSPAHSREVRVF
jgi:hypothetical protein